ncbi:tRNA uridine-5-carboxymethylaminomethyl(34) synthesis GTPase MnmE [Fundidesulfovibrio soli]|uniref:tRNA uridine-5-carboxymethylaminomethyl(34) synthesis GTPase MnmE n=1 Tax=Fundidesulfovibrio soli TaxID=2922716 RepID=UPI001FAFDFAF|nr:tRNA uridine-5-carboxymethylaminomethyl(34) synthesis GTPase MnmE [Fundidesulfovibrio soli]
MRAAYSPKDTIAAIVTAPGRGGVGVVRLSGPEARRIGQAMFRSARPDFSGFKPYRLHHGTLLDERGQPLDDVLAASMPGPGSYTGEDVLEFHCHGSPAILQAAVNAAVALGARHAQRGEFTRRAFLAGRMDLSQAQAVAELIAARTTAGAHLALSRLEGLMGRRVSELRARLETLRQRICLAVDFPDDEGECLDEADFLAVLDEVGSAIERMRAAHVRSRPLREGETVVLAGPVNAGKSSLLNALVGRERAIVCDAPGTTRDFLEEQIDLDGLPLRLVDTAGLREAADTAADPVEREGQARCMDLMKASSLVLLVLDGSRPFDPAGLQCECGPVSLDPARVLGVVNKADLPFGASGGSGGDPRLLLTEAGIEVLEVSARTGQGLEGLCAALRRRLLEHGPQADSGVPVPNDRENALLALAAQELEALAQDTRAGVPPDLLGVRLEGVCSRLAEITGEIAPGDVLNAIFDGFCIGK